jgi:hypothetical protein
MLWSYAHGLAVLAIGDNLKGAAAADLLEGGLRKLMAA